MQGVILAAGSGSRLHPLTRERSKAMLPIVGRPIVERIMSDLGACGVSELILVIRPDDREIGRHFREHRAFRRSVRLVVQRQPRGMADALLCAAPLITGDFVLSACDNLVPKEETSRMLTRWGSSASPSALLAVLPVKEEDVDSTAVVEMEGDRITRIVEKPSPDQTPSRVASMALYCFSHTMLEYLEKVRPSIRGERELQDAIQMMIDDGAPVRGHRIRRRLTLTAPADLLDVNRHYLARSAERPDQSQVPVGPRTRIVEPVYIENNTLIGADCVIGPNVYIERDCVVGKEVVRAIPWCCVAHLSPMDRPWRGRSCPETTSSTSGSGRGPAKPSRCPRRRPRLEPGRPTK